MCCDNALHTSTRCLYKPCAEVIGSSIPSKMQMWILRTEDGRLEGNGDTDSSASVFELRQKSFAATRENIDEQCSLQQFGPSDNCALN